MVDHGYSSKIERLGIPDRYIEHGTQGELHAECNYDKSSIIKAVKSMTRVKENASSKSA
jgi:1-deoxy-D-xylulose-5-phosphate synthase